MKKLILIVVLISLNSCVKYEWEKLWYIKKEMTYTDVTEIMSSSKYFDGIDYINDKEEDTFDLTEILGFNSKVLLSRKKYYPPLANYNSYYAFYFKEDKLVFWGKIYEFARHKNTELNKVAEEITKIIGEKYEN